MVNKYLNLNFESVTLEITYNQEVQEMSSNARTSIYIDEIR